MTTQTIPHGDSAAPLLHGVVPRTMQAIVQNGYGSADALRLATTMTPTIGDRDVLVRVSAAGVDRATWHVMTGRPYVGRLALGLRSPKSSIPGTDLAGTVVQVGAEVERFAVGDRVVGIGRGAFAEYAMVAEDKLASLPHDVSFDVAAALPDSGLTALQAVGDVGRVTAGQTVLIIGASGGVGSFAVQIATHLGAHVTGVCSTAKSELVSSLGATRVIDYTRESIDADGATYDVVIDLGGNTPLRRLRRVLDRSGTMVIVGGEGGGRWFGGTDRQLRALAVSPFTAQRLTTFITTEHHAGLDWLAAAVAAGTLVPVVTRHYELSDAPQAIDDLVAGRIAGKAIVVVDAP